MFISEKIVFIELHKTGSSHIGKLLSILLEGEQTGKHSPATPDLFTDQRSFLGSIRDPWEWYVSLWAFGCDRKGVVYDYLTRENSWTRWKNWRHRPLSTASSLLKNHAKDPDRWKRCYSNVNDASGFRDWLHMIHGKNFWNDIEEDYSSYPLKEFSGLLTYRYLRLFCLGNFKNVTSLDDLKVFEKHNCYINHFIRNENLEDDFIRVLELCGTKLSRAQIKAIYSSVKTNISSREENISYYYDNDTINLVNDREHLIIDKFGYTPPTTGNQPVNSLTSR